MRKSKVKTLTGVIITMGVVLAVTGAGTILLKQNYDKQAAEYKALAAQTASNTHTVFVAMVPETEDGEESLITPIVPKGTVLEEGVNVEKVSVFTSLPESAYMSEEDLGKPLMNDVPDGTPIYHAMVAQDGAEEGDREYNISVAHLMGSLQENEYVDVRVLFPNGDDYCILSKKRVQNLNTEEVSFDCLMNEEEILCMGAATIDAYTLGGSYIYVTRYADGTMAEETIPTYPVRSSTISLMAQNPNVLTQAIETLNKEARLNLETRLSNLTKEQVEAVVNGAELNDASDASILLEGARSYEVDGESSDAKIKEYDWTFEFSEEEPVLEEEAE